MRKILFLITELQRPVGGLYRFATEYLPVWKNAVDEKTTDFEPLVFAPRDATLPLDDLVTERKFEGIAKTHALKIYSAIRRNVKCYFVESALDGKALADFHYKLWEKYRIKSEKAAHSPYYNRVLCPFWNAVPKIAKSLVENGESIACIDTQDWLSFPAGFLTKEEIKKPLVCRFHSGEFGRTMNAPDLDNAPVRIEAAAFQEADYIIGVSVPEAKYEITNLLPLTEKLNQELKSKKGEIWYGYQKWKQREYRRLLFFEPEKMHLVGKNVAGIPNGIILDEWKMIRAEEITAAREWLKKNLPDKEKFLLFIGRTERRKGLPPLIEAMKKVIQEVNAGLVIASVMNDEEYKNCEKELAEKGLENHVIIEREWLNDKQKMVLLCAPDILVLPSLYEPFGIVTLEGLAADLACERNGFVGPVVITGDTGGMKNVIRSGVDGFKVPVENFHIEPELLASAITMILTHDDLHKRISKSGAARVEDEIFNWRNTLRHVLRIYEIAINNYTMWESAV